MPTSFVNYQSTFTLSPAGGATGTWQFDASLLPDPIAFMSVAKTDSTGITTSLNLNSQLTGATYGTKYVAFQGVAQRWRLAYMSVTAYQDGPDLSNQGMISVVQKPAQPAVYYGSGMTGTQVTCGPKITKFQTDDAPDFNSSQTFPNAYLNNSKFGAYAPMKLTSTCQQWKDLFRDITLYGGATSATSGAGLTLPTATGAMVNWPYYGENEAAYLAANGFMGQTILEWGNGAHVQISARNLSVATSFTFYVRCGIEIQCNPGTIYGPYLKLSPPHDSRALKTYFAIAREMKDAYPADYNDLGKIWETIKSILRKVAPAIGMIPFPGSGIVSAAINPGLDMIESLEKALKQKKNVSAADLDRARMKIAARK
jgi:hypothetical protein